jgi:hypothetical protein
MRSVITFLLEDTYSTSSVKVVRLISLPLMSESGSVKSNMMLHCSSLRTKRSSRSDAGTSAQIPVSQGRDRETETQSERRFIRTSERLELLDLDLLLHTKAGRVLPLCVLDDRDPFSLLLLELVNQPRLGRLCSQVVLVHTALKSSVM